MFNECSMNEQTLDQLKVDQNGRSKTIEKSNPSNVLLLLENI